MDTLTLSPSSYLTHLYTTKLHVRQQSGSLNSTGLPHPVPESSHVLQSFLALGWGCPLLPTRICSLWLLGQNTTFAAGKAAEKLGTLNLSCCSLNYLRIFTGRCQHKAVLHSFSLAVAPILMDPALSPAGNPSDLSSPMKISLGNSGW